jgi:molecular chaperone GrpE
MSKSNGQADLRSEVQQNVEQQRDRQEPELPPADANDGFAEGQDATPAAEPVSAKVEPIRASGDAEKLRTERDNLFDRLARLQAEFDNFRKRSQKESSDFRDYALADAARNLLPVIDNFSLALKNAAANPDEFKKGVELIHKQLQDVLQKMNVQRVSAQGQPFDPRVHEAIEMVESNDVEDNHVLEELQPGYKIKERLLRPAMVRVAKNTKQVN